jgi:hypothetical protein
MSEPTKPEMKLLTEASPQDIRLNGLIDLELGSESKWMLVMRDKTIDSPRLIVPPGRVTFGEVIHNLRIVADAIEQLAKAKGK